MKIFAVVLVLVAAASANPIIAVDQVLGGAVGLVGGANLGATVGATVGVAGGLVNAVVTGVVALTGDVTVSVISLTKIIPGGIIGNTHLGKAISTQLRLLAIIKYCAAFSGLASFKLELVFGILLELVASLELHFGVEICAELTETLAKIQSYLECLIANIDKKDYKAITSCTKNLKKHLVLLFSGFSILCGFFDIENISDEARVIISAGIAILLVVVTGVTLVVNTISVAVLASLKLAEKVTLTADLQVAIKVVGKAVLLSKGGFDVMGLGVTGLNDELKGIISFVAGAVVTLKPSAIIDVLLRIRMSIVVALNACLKDLGLSIIGEALIGFNYTEKFAFNNQVLNKNYKD